MFLHNSESIVLEPVAPYSFELTLHKPAGWWWSTPSEKYEKDVLWTAVRFNERLLGLRLESRGTLNKPKISCTVFSKKKLETSEKNDFEFMLRRSLRTDEDLTEFYGFAANDSILKDVTTDLCGMHSVAWPELLPSLILAVTLQMAPMKRSSQMMDLLLEQFGEQAKFDSKVICHWPSAKKIASVDVAELQSRAKLGYRAKNLVAIAKALVAGFPSMDELSTMERSEARKQLLTLRGIGEYSADLVLTEMGFPLDVWSAKIFGVLLFGKVPEDPRENIPRLKTEANKRWGKWASQAFAYVLNDLPKLSKRVGTDLTRF